MKLLLLVIFITFSYSLIAAEKNKPTLRFCYGSWAPFEYYQSGDKGLNIETMNAIAQKLNINIQWYAIPWKRCLKKARRGDFDGLLSFFKNKARKQFFYYPKTHFYSLQTVFYQNVNSQIHYDGTLESLRGKTVIVSDENSYGDEFDNTQLLKKYFVARGNAPLKMIARKRFDLGIDSLFYLVRKSKEYKIDKQIKIISPPYKVNNTYFGISKKAKNAQNITQLFSDELAKFKASTQYKELFKKYKIHEFTNLPKK